MFQTDELIAAPASAAGEGMRSIVRISGPEVKSVLSDIFTPIDHARWSKARFAQSFTGDLNLTAFDFSISCRVDFWPTEKSFTGQPLAEVHIIGCPPVVESILTELYQRDVRPAKRGEFTLRAFLAGRVDLVQAEAVLGVIDADDHQELKLALSQLAGGISHQLESVKEELLLILADLEAGLDFVEEDIEFIPRDVLRDRLNQILHSLSRLQSQAEDRSQSKRAYRIVLAGLPNAGKSTLFNLLSEKQSALVSDIQGTTRDYLIAPLIWEGFSIELLDTAGYESDVNSISESTIAHNTNKESLSHSHIAFQSQRLGQEQWDRADLLVWCEASDATCEAERVGLAELYTWQEKNPGKSLLVQTKADLCMQSEAWGTNSHNVDLSVSQFHADSIETLKQTIIQQLREPQNSNAELLGSTLARCKESLHHAIGAIEATIALSVEKRGDELIAIEIRDALDFLGRILGTVFTDDLLDRIFSRFCIGK